MLSAGDSETERLGDRALLPGVVPVARAGPGKALNAAADATDDEEDVIAVPATPPELLAGPVDRIVDVEDEPGALLSFSSALPT